MQGGGVCAAAERVAATQLIHLRSEVLAAHNFRTQIIHVSGGKFEGRVVHNPVVIGDVDIENIVQFILLIKHVCPVAKGEGGHLPGEIHEHGLDGLHLSLLDFLHEVTDCVAVRYDRSNLRSGNLLY